MQPFIAFLRAQIFPIQPKRLVSADNVQHIFGQVAGKSFDDDIGNRRGINICRIGMPSADMNILMNAGNIGQIRAKRTQGGHIVRPQMHLPTEFAVQNTGEPPRNADVAEIVDDLAKNPTDKRRSIHRNNGNGLKRAKIVEQIHNQQNNRNKQQHSLTFQIKLLFQMMLDGVEKDEFKQKRRFAGKDDAVDQMLEFVFGRIGGENGKRRQRDEADGKPADKQVSGHCKAFKKAKRHYRPKRTPCLTDAPEMPSEALPQENAAPPNL